MGSAGRRRPRRPGRDVGNVVAERAVHLHPDDGAQRGQPAGRRSVIDMTSVAFYFVDVFASRPLTGNPVSLVPDADGLDESQMQAIAREFNQSETAFLLRPTVAGATTRLRSFTPIGAEVFGAGHHALGAWLWLAASDRLLGDGGGL